MNTCRAGACAGACRAVQGAVHALQPPRAVLQVGVVSAFAQTLRRYTSLNHLAQAARAVLQNTSQINQMLSDLNRVDFANVQVTTGSSPPQLLLTWGSTASLSLCWYPVNSAPSAGTQLSDGYWCYFARCRCRT